MILKRRLNFFDRLILWLNGLVCILLLISYLAPVTDPQKYWIVAFFGLAYPPLLLATTIFLLYWLLRKKWLLILLPLLSILAGWSVLNKNIGLRFPALAGHGPAERTIRVMTYNVHNFKKYGSNNDESTRHEILGLIADQRPDILGFEEYYTQYKGQYAMTDSILQVTGVKYSYFQPILYNSSEGIGMALFSRYPIVAKGWLKISDDKSINQCIYIDVKKDTSIFRIYAVHLQSIRFEAEDYKYINAITHQHKADLSSTKRLGSKLKNAFISRSKQVAILKAHFAQCPYPYFLMGDFNDTPSSYAVDKMSKGLKNAFVEKGSGLGRTYNGSFPNYQIDYIMTGPKFDVQSYQVIERRLSDHYPVCSDLLLK